MTKMHFLKSSILLLLSPLILSACAIGPSHQPPDIATGSAWSVSVDTADPTLVEWWMTFEDPELYRLIESASLQNLDIRQALSRIDEARARRDAAFGGFLPKVNTHAGITRQQLSENGSFPIGFISGFENPQTIHDVGFDVSWEVDLFGRTRKRVEVADAVIDQANARAVDVTLTVTAEVARNYFELRGSQHELIARRAGAAAAQRTLQFVETRQRLGESTVADVARSRAALAVQRTGMPQLESRIRGSTYALSTLLGRLPESELTLIDKVVEIKALAPVPVGQRADILRRRADVRIAERQLAAATAQIGISMAEIFPKLSIGLGGAFQARDAGDLFDTASQRWNVGPVISWRIFAGGRIKAEIRVSEARAEQAALAYEQTVIGAIADAEQALSHYQFALDGLELQRNAEEAASSSYSYADSRYRAGDTTLLELLSAEQALNQAHQSYAAAHAGAAVKLVRLFKALGGAW